MTADKLLLKILSGRSIPAVGAKHSGSPFSILSSRLSTGMLRPYGMLRPTVVQ